MIPRLRGSLLIWVILLAARECWGNVHHRLVSRETARTMYQMLDRRFGSAPQPLPAEGQAQVGSLELLQVIYRHGDRAPISSYPTDPYNNVSYWPQGWGQLTNRGKTMEYHLGQFLRHRYDGFINKKYKYEQIYVRSTDVDRTLMSAATNLAGLFPPIGDELWDPSIDWQPVPIHTMPKDVDPLTMDSKCPRYEIELQKLYNSTEMKQLLSQFQELFAYLWRHTGKVLDTPKQVGDLYDTLLIEKLYNLTLPAWTDSVYPTAMHPLFLLSFAIIGYTPEMARLRGGPVLGEMITNMKEKIDGRLSPASRKFFMYSAHDSTLAALQQALGVYNNVPPPYASMIIVELHRSANNSSFVRMFYKNDTSEEPKLWQLQVKNCAADCPLETFESLMHPMVPLDWHKECNSEKLDVFIASLPGITIGATILAGVLGLVLMASILIGLMFWQRSMKPYRYFTVQAE